MSGPLSRHDPSVGQVIPAELMLALLRMANDEDSLDVAEDELLDHHRTQVYQQVIQATWGGAYAAALGYRVTVAESGDRIEVGDRPAAWSSTVDREAVADEVVEHLWRNGWRPPPGVASVGDDPPIWAELVAAARAAGSRPAEPTAPVAPVAASLAEPLPHRVPDATALEAGEATEDAWVTLPTDRAATALQNWANGGAEELDAMYAEARGAQQAAEGGAPC